MIQLPNYTLATLAHTSALETAVLVENHSYDQHENRANYEAADAELRSTAIKTTIMKTLKPLLN